MEKEYITPLSHDELMAQKGIYYGLVQAQLQMQG